MRKKIPLPTGDGIRQTLFSLGELGDPDYFVKACRRKLSEWRKSPTFKSLLSSELLGNLVEDLERNLAFIEKCLGPQHPLLAIDSTRSTHICIPDPLDAVGAGMTAAFEFMAITSIMEAPMGGNTPNREMWAYVQAEEDKNPKRTPRAKGKAALEQWAQDKLASLSLSEQSKQLVKLTPPLTLKHIVRTYTKHVKQRRKPASTLTDDPSQASRKTSV